MRVADCPSCASLLPSERSFRRGRVIYRLWAFKRSVGDTDGLAGYSVIAVRRRRESSLRKSRVADAPSVSLRPVLSDRVDDEITRSIPAVQDGQVSPIRVIGSEIKTHTNACRENTLDCVGNFFYEFETVF